MIQQWAGWQVTIAKPNNDIQQINKWSRIKRSNYNCGCAGCVTIISAENGIGDPSSIPAWGNHFYINTLGKIMNPILLPPAMS